jgi:hypothetical protein
MYAHAVSPGLREIVPRIRLFDVFDATPAQPPRPRSAHEGIDLPCPAFDLTLAGTAPRTR